jgi:hypothetical protein
MEYEGPADDEDEERDMSVIEEEQEEHEEVASSSEEGGLEGSELEQAMEDYVPNMHLLDLDPSIFTRRHFMTTLEQLKG